MAFTLEEKPTSRQWNLGDTWECTFLYTLRGESDDVDARDYVLAHAPTSHDGLPRTGVTLDPVVTDTVTDTGKWDVTVKFSTFIVTPGSTSSYGFDTTGGTQHITQSLETVAAYAPPAKTAPDHKGAIGVTKDSVEGVDVVVPAFAWTETHYLSNAVVTDAYKTILKNMTGRWNDAPWRTYEAGEVKFGGVVGARRSGEFWELTFKFAESPNVTGITIGDITGISKQGWDYLWVQYEDTEDDTAKAIVKRPVAVYVERVAYSGSFGDLGLD
jgi:hypothetical protein